MAVVCRCEDHGPSAQTLTGSYQVVMCVGRAARESDSFSSFLCLGGGGIAAHEPDDRQQVQYERTDPIDHLTAHTLSAELPVTCDQERAY